MNTAVLVLENGQVFTGRSFGAVGETLGEAVFCTAMTGYQETLTDPSYHRQIVVATAPQFRPRPAGDVADAAHVLGLPAGIIEPAGAAITRTWEGATPGERREEHPDRGVRTAFAQDQVGGQIAGAPVAAQGRGIGAHLQEGVAQG